MRMIDRVSLLLSKNKNQKGFNKTANKQFQQELIEAIEYQLSEYNIHADVTLLDEVSEADYGNLSSLVQMQFVSVPADADVVEFYEAKMDTKIVDLINKYDVYYPSQISGTYKDGKVQETKGEIQFHIPNTNADAFEDELSPIIGAEDIEDYMVNIIEQIINEVLKEVKIEEE
jgi:hypothetical protein